MASRSLGTLTIDLVAKTFGFEQGMDRTSRAFEKRVKELERSAKQFGTAIGTALAVGVTAAGAALAKITTDAVNYADQLDELSNRLGISTEQLSAWGYAAKLTGSDIESLASTLPRLSKNLAAAMDEGSKQAELFEALGISVTDAAGNLRDVEDVLPEIADKFKQLKNDTTEAALAQELFGKSGAEFLEFLNLGSDGLERMAGEAQELGAVVDGQTAAAAAEFKDELDRLSTAATGLGTQIAAQLLPTIVDLVNDMTDWVKQGDLARNITTLITAAVDLGVGAIDAYNNAVDRTSIAIGTAVETAAGWLEIQKQIATLGFAEGSVSGGWARIKNAFTTGQQELDDLVARQNAPREQPRVDEEWLYRGAPTAPGESTGLDKRLNRYLRDADGKEKAAKATKELTDAEKAWKAVMEDNALIDEQVQDYRSQQIQDAYELEKAREAAAKRVDQQIDDMQHEYEILGLTNRERAQEIELRYAGAEATDEQRKKIADLAGAIHDENEALERQIDAMDSVRDSAGSFLSDLKDGVAPLDAFTNAVDRLIDKLFDLSADWLIDSLLGQQGDTAGGSAGGWLQAFAGLFGGGRASGGWAMPNTLYEVNERGMEMATVRGRDYLLTGSSPVQITPNNRLGARGFRDQNVVFNVQGSIDPRSKDQILQEMGRQARIAGRNS
jgi:hypothetical protein